MASDESSSRGRNIKLGLAIAGLAAAGIIAFYQLSGPDAADNARVRNYMDIATNKPFSHELAIGESEPVRAPSGQMTGYAAETCYWGKDASGKWYIKNEPTYVVLKSRIDANSTEETMCPDCGRRVAGHNRKPTQEDIDRANAGQDDGESEPTERTRE